MAELESWASNFCGSEVYEFNMLDIELQDLIYTANFCLLFDCKFTLIFPLCIKTVWNNNLLCPYRLKYMISGVIAWHKQLVYAFLWRIIALVPSFTPLPVFSLDSFEPSWDFPWLLKRLLVVTLIQLIFGRSCCWDITGVSSNVPRIPSTIYIYKYIFRNYICIQQQLLDFKGTSFKNSQCLKF